MIPSITVYGAERCHKTQHFISFLKMKELDFVFLDVETSDKNAEKLRSLYVHRKLNFPTITIGTKKLRNPSDNELLKWIS